MTNKANTDEQVNFFIGIRFVAILSIIVGVLVYGFNYLSNKRNTEIVDRYNSETNEYITRNQQGIAFIFHSLFDASLICHDLNNYQHQANCEKSISNSIHANLDENIKDYSSMAFLRIEPKSQKLERMNLSGNVRDASINYRYETEVLDLLSGKKNRLKWEDYTYEFQDKEVIVPVVFDGKVVGAIIRGVIQ